MSSFHYFRGIPDRADHIGIFLEATLHALEPGLRPMVVRRDMAAIRTGAACVPRRHGNKPAAVPRQLVM